MKPSCRNSIPAKVIFIHPKNRFLVAEYQVTAAFFGHIISTIKESFVIPSIDQGSECMYKRGNVFWADLSPVIGSEQDGFRPVVILQNNTGNRYSPTVIVAPLTSNLHPDKNFITHVPVQMQGLPHCSIILLEQIRTIDKTRLGRFIGTLDMRTLQQVNQSLLCSLGL